MVLTREEKELFIDITSEMKLMKEEIHRMHNKLDGMSKYYAQALTKQQINSDAKNAEKTKDDKPTKRKKTVPRQKNKRAR